MDKYIHANSHLFDWSFVKSNDNNSKIYGVWYYINDFDIITDMQLKHDDNLWYKFGPIPNTDNTVYKWQNIVTRRTSDILIDKMTSLNDMVDVKKMYAKIEEKKTV